MLPAGCGKQAVREGHHRWTTPSLVLGHWQVPAWHVMAPLHSSIVQTESAVQHVAPSARLVPGVRHVLSAVQYVPAWAMQRQKQNSTFICAFNGVPFAAVGRVVGTGSLPPNTPTCLWCIRTLSFPPSRMSCRQRTGPSLRQASQHSSRHPRPCCRWQQQSRCCERGTTQSLQWQTQQECAELRPAHAHAVDQQCALPIPLPVPQESVVKSASGSVGLLFVVPLTATACKEHSNAPSST